MALNPKIADWQGKRVWVVGASTGIGLALATALGARGARLVLSARNAGRLQTAATGIAGAQAVPLDVSDPAQWPHAARAAEAALGGLDVVVFNAGTYAPLRAWELTAPCHEPDGSGSPPRGANQSWGGPAIDSGGLATVRQTFETNLMGVYSGLAAVLPGLLAQGSGQIVLVSSVAGYGGLPRALAYGPGKAALINLAECLYMDLAPRGLGVTLVCPGFVETPLTAQNDFDMPALISTTQAAAAILQGLRAGRFEIHFPRRFSLSLKLLGLLPRRLYFRLVGALA